MLLTRDQIQLLYLGLYKYPDAEYILIREEENGSGIGKDTVAVFQDRGNLFRKIAPRDLGTEDITDVSTW